MVARRQPAQVRPGAFGLVPMRRDEEVQHLLSLKRQHRLGVHFQHEFRKPEPAWQRLHIEAAAVLRNPLTRDGTSHALRRQAPSVAVATFGTALLDENEPPLVQLVEHIEIGLRLCLAV